MKELRPVILGAFGPPTLACIRSWGRLGMSPGMIAVMTATEPSPRSAYLVDSIELSRNELYGEKGLAVITEFLSEFKASGLVCIDENIAQWLNQHKENLPAGVDLWVPSNEMLQQVLDKTIQIQFARQVGLTVLPTYLFIGSDFNDEIPVDHFPLCLRPSAPNSVEPQFKAENVNSLKELRNFLAPLTISQPVIGQTFRNLPNLVVHGTRLADGTTVGMEGFIVDRKFQGLSLTIKPEPLGEDLESRCVAFTEAMGLVGNYHFDFLHDPEIQKSYFLEINHRFGGTTAKVLVSGYDEPLYALQAQGITQNNKSKVRDVTVSSFKALVKSALFALAGRLTPLDYPEESKLQRVLSTCKCLIYCKDEVFSWDDLSGTAVFYFGDLPGRLQQIVSYKVRALFGKRDKLE